MDYAQIRVRKDRAVTWVELFNPPEHLFTMRMTIELESLIRERERDESTRVIVFTGSETGRFIEMYDSRQILDAAERFKRLGLSRPPAGLVLGLARVLNAFISVFPGAGDALTMRMSDGLFSGLAQLVRFSRLLALMESSHMIFIAAISGNCMGGACEFACACDYRFAVDGKGYLLGHPEPLVAMPPAGGGCQRLSRHIGVGRAAAMILDGRPVETDEAMSMGLLTGAFPEETFTEEVKNHADRLATRAPQATRAIKRLLYKGTRLSYEKAFTLEKRAVLSTSTMEDAIEGLRVYNSGKKEDPEEESARAMDLYEGRLITLKGR